MKIKKILHNIQKLCKSATHVGMNQVKSSLFRQHISARQNLSASQNTVREIKTGLKNKTS